MITFVIGLNKFFRERSEIRRKERKIRSLNYLKELSEKDMEDILEIAGSNCQADENMDVFYKIVERLVYYPYL